MSDQREGDGMPDIERSHNDGPHEGCMDRACECVQAEAERLRRAFRRLYHHAHGTWPTGSQIEHWMDIGDADAL